MNVSQRIGDRPPQDPPESPAHASDCEAFFKKAFPPVLERTKPGSVLWEGKELLYFAGCDYYGLSRHPQVLEQAGRAVTESGINVAASRLTTGNHRVYNELESRLASFLGVPRVLLIGSGYTSNLVVAQALRGQLDLLWVDARAHGSLLDAVELLAVPVRLFQHRNPADLARQLETVSAGTRMALLTDGVFPLDGSTAPLSVYQRVLPAGAWLWVDDAHGVGVLGDMGRGTTSCSSLDPERLIQTGTLSKAFGVGGGFVRCPESVLQGIVQRSRMFAGSTPLSPALARAACASIELLEQHPEWRTQLLQYSREVHPWFPLEETEVNDCDPDGALRGPIGAWKVNDSMTQRTLQSLLIEHGIYPSWIRYPGAPGDGLFRFSWSASIPREALDVFLHACRAACTHPQTGGVCRRIDRS